MKILALVVLSVLFASVASAQMKTADATVFGLHLGEKFSVPECARSKSSDASAVEYDYETPSSPCFEVDPVLRKDLREFGGSIPPPPNAPVLNDENTKIHFPNNMLADLTLDLEAEIIDGNLEGVFIGTDGLTSQDRILATLKAKYGDPTVLEEQRKQNAMGAVFNCHHASWQFDNLVVTFLGAADQTDVGIVSIETKKHAEFRRTNSERVQAEAPKL
jgi:hypothetical protein